MRPKKIESLNKKDVHDIFKMPKSLGGQVEENATKTGYNINENKLESNY